ncbi:MarR family winged helix-turn-helix transcriptional regulator [Streptomyces sp. H27-H5]|uniref:MarR family winged helix-turn-helix transcriptional regulator n=1 Tax=Streptomyces sp. H27-H5 TaxID=2996460 RepID=UPI00226E329C|nr:MarR family winged helix-turn-helix transcriptional regulator [Streptomyces sp. H27-H5]MCY0961267.1 MarR family winged helix-turn-helix transcriptional regulator [Streptomyces sp. H27-H5]
MSQPAPNLPQLLTQAKRWFEDALLAAMRAAGEQSVSPAQAAVFATLDGESASIADLARRIGVTRQTAHQAVHSLIGMGLLEQTPDPASARSSLVRVSAEGARVHRRALAAIAVIEDVLAERIGVVAVASLRDALNAPWGEPPLVVSPDIDQGRPSPVGPPPSTGGDRPR